MVRIVSIFFLRTKIENVADQKWSADRTLGNTALKAAKLGLRESYKRFAKKWICFTNPWIRIVLWSRILTPKRFDLCLTKWKLDLYCIVDHKSWHKKNFFLFENWLVSRIQRILTNPDLRSCKSRILSNPDLQTRESRILTNPDLRICESRFESRTIKICIADSIRKAKNLKLLHLFWFGRICVKIPQAYAKYF